MRRAIFFDRDNTVVEDVVHCSKPEDIHVFPGVPAAFFNLNNAGYLTIMITNQSVVGRGIIDEIMLDKIHNKLRMDIFPGIIDDIFYCPHSLDIECNCRKPRVGLGIRALVKYGIDPKYSFMLGDSDKDVQFGDALGCRKSIKVSKVYTFCDAVFDILTGKY